MTNNEPREKSRANFLALSKSTGKYNEAMPKHTTPPMRQRTKPKIRCFRDNQLESSSLLPFEEDDDGNQ